MIIRIDDPAERFLVESAFSEPPVDAFFERFSRNWLVYRLVHFLRRILYFGFLRRHLGKVLSRSLRGVFRLCFLLFFFVLPYISGSTFRSEQVRKDKQFVNFIDYLFFLLLGGHVFRPSDDTLRKYADFVYRC